jgi:hypothetical protein
MGPLRGRAFMEHQDRSHEKAQERGEERPRVLSAQLGSAFELSYKGANHVCERHLGSAGQLSLQVTAVPASTMGS